MVKTVTQLVQPHNECSCCHEPFKHGDKAICIVQVPNGSYDTICVGDWALIMASSAKELANFPGNLDYRGMRGLFLTALGLYLDMQDTEADPGA